MKHFRRFLALAAGVLLAATASAQAQNNQPAPAADPPATRVPILRLDAEGPVSQITSLLLSPDGKTLYAAGWDKAVYAWTLDGEGKFQFAPTKALRIPIGPDVSGTINALAISADGRYLAVGGRAFGKRFTDFRSGGLIFPAATQSENDRRDTGTIYVFDLANPGQVAHLRGHLGTVLFLTFAPSQGNQSPVLVSAAEETKEGKSFGAVRVWDINNPKESIAAYTDLVAPSKAKASDGKPWQPPRAITALRTGDGPKNVLVGMAWGENVFRVWDVAKNSSVNVTNYYSFVCAEVDNQFLLAGGYRRGPDKKDGWHLGLWKPPVSDSAQQPNPALRSFQANTFPLGLAKASKADVILGVARDSAGNAGFFLADSNSLNRLPVSASDKVFGGQSQRPAFTISSDGKTVAVAGNVDRTIQVFSVVGDNKLSEPQILTAQGDSFPLVRFYRNGQSLGLGLDKDLKAAQANDIIFDLTGGQVAANPQGWNPAPANAGITAKLGRQADRNTVVLDLGQGKTTTIILPKDQFVDPNQPAETQIALCPKTDNHPALLGLIVKSQDFAETVLRVYNAETGDRLRQFSGHTDAITSIAFSDDGKLLASAGLDRTVRVWWLEDLKSHIGQHGFLDNLILTDINGKASVQEIDPFAKADVRNALQVGDVIEGFIRPSGEPQATPKSFPFFYYLSTVPPVSEDNNQPNKVKLQIVRAGQKLAATPEVQVQQGVDERKPLFTLFFKEGQAGQPASWIGWTPLGPFDSSDADIQTLVGWHFNPPQAQPDALSTYSTLAEYRTDHFTKGMFKSLIETGAIAPPVPPQDDQGVGSLPEVPPIEPPPPWQPERAVKLSLSIHETQGEGVAQEIRNPRLDDRKQVWTETTGLIAALSVRGLPATQARDKLIWTLDGIRQAFSVTETSTGRFDADLSGFAWKAKPNNEPYVLEVALVDDAMEVKPARQAIVFAPPPPPVKEPEKKLPLPNIVSPDVVTTLYDQYNQPQTEILVDLSPDGESPVLAGQLTFERNGQPVEKDGQVLVHEFDETTREIKETLPLVHGENLLRAKVEAKDQSQTLLSNSVSVSYRRPPRMKSTTAKADAIQPRAEITSEIVTPEDRKIVEYKIYVNDKTFTFGGDLVTAVQDETDKTLWKVTARNVPLTEGKNTIRFVPRNEDGRVFSTPVIEVEWTRPPVPVKPLPSRPAVVFVNVNSQVPLAGYWQGQTFQVAYNIVAPGKLQKVLVYYNGKRLDPPAIPNPTEDSGSEYEFQLAVPLTGQQNQLRVVAMDENARLAEETVTLAPLKPPVTLKIDSLEVRGQNLALAPINPESQTVTFPPSPDGRVILRGHISTSDSTMTFERPFVKCWVNGSLFWARANRGTDPEKPTEWTFAMNLCLNREKGNTFHLELPEAPKTPFSQTRGYVDCANPITKQTLRVLLAGIDPATLRRMDMAALKKRIEAVLAQKGQNNAFDKIEFYPLSNPRLVRADEITAQLETIHKESESEARRGEHVVVMVYYHGKEELNPKGELVLRTNDRLTDNTALTDKELIEQLNRTSGAHLVLLGSRPRQAVGRELEVGAVLGRAEKHLERENARRCFAAFGRLGKSASENQPTRPTAQKREGRPQGPTPHNRRQHPRRSQADPSGLGETLESVPSPLGGEG